MTLLADEVASASAKARPVRRRRTETTSGRIWSAGADDAPGAERGHRGRPDIVARTTIGPGLAGALLVRVAMTRRTPRGGTCRSTRSTTSAGILAADVCDHGPLPRSVGLLVSGGHTHLPCALAGEPIVELGGTVDDAAGRAYDKIARACWGSAARRQR